MYLVSDVTNPNGSTLKVGIHQSGLCIVVEVVGGVIVVVVVVAATLGLF